MSTDKHLVESLAERLEADYADLDDCENAAVMLRTIPSLEAERDALRAEVASLRDALCDIASNSLDSYAQDTASKALDASQAAAVARGADQGRR